MFGLYCPRMIIRRGIQPCDFFVGDVLLFRCGMICRVRSLELVWSDDLSEVTDYCVGTLLGQKTINRSGVSASSRFFDVIGHYRPRRRLTWKKTVAGHAETVTHIIPAMLTWRIRRS